MNKEAVIIEVYDNKNVIKYCKAITKEWEELKSQLILQLLKMSDKKLKHAVDNNYLEYLCFTICKRIVSGNISDSGIFYKKHLFNDELYDVVDEVDTTYNLVDEVDEILNNLHWYNKSLFNFYYKDGYNYREISEMTGINIKSVFHTIKLTKDLIKNKIKENGNYFD